MNIKFEQRPKCSCGAKMKLVEYKGYYDSFKYWCCDNCSLDDEIQDIKPDSVGKGSYVY